MFYIPILMLSNRCGILEYNNQPFLLKQLPQRSIITRIIALDSFTCSDIFFFEIFYEIQQFCVQLNFLLNK